MHMEWADASVWRVLLSSPDAVRDSRCRDLLQHYTLTQRAFLDLWRGREIDPLALGAAVSPDLRATAASQRRYYRDLFE